MNNDDVFEYLRENLEIKVERVESETFGGGVEYSNRIMLVLDGIVISEDYID